MVGGICLLASKRHIKLAEYATAFAAGALLSAAFIDLLPEAAETGEPETVFIAVLAGILTFFLLEGLVHWFHHHHHHDEHQPTDPVVPLVIIGDTVHNFIDGIAIAAGFLVDPLTGIIVTLAVAAHEIPQEIGDFGLLLHKGVKRSKVLLINIASALATTVAAVIFYLVGQSLDVEPYLAPVLGFVAGFFIYIAVSDIIPSIHHEKSRKLVLRQSIILLIGVILVGVAIRLLHGFIE
ncbi:hypothetical protein FACS189431_2960 [Alphaproteobacteria bacterium]|nr:hypothetical protein FACS189431_2960 [Alphaproteobacteria bacterium]